MEDRKAIEQFLMDIEVLDALESRISGFNTFETLGLVSTEIRHSNMLGWLMSPKENHGLGELFLKKFVQEVFYHHQHSFLNADIGLIDISLMDYSAFVVRREYKNMDLLLYAEAYNIVIAIENKIWSKESAHQLKNYFMKVQHEFPEYHQIFLFLTPSGERPSDEENWISISYEYVLKALKKSLDLKKDQLTPPVEFFIKQYEEILRRYIVGDKELESICRNIYFKHRKALDLIFQYKPDIFSDIAVALQEKLQSHPHIKMDTSNKTYIRFTTNELDNLIEKGGTWTDSGRILLFEIQNKNGKIVMKAIIGPGDATVRQKLYDIKAAFPETLKGTVNKLGAQYTQIFSKEMVSRAYIENSEHDNEKVVKKAVTELKKFLSNELHEIERVIIENYK
ncbi:PD-(D/E)XK nuclease family protein [Domibacillus sp. DTU_2020_1001157_1_SI_ALB_TIR_016]|uniref:PDDEXK-like family protein n=1 Tax=Domibacillus sp. DTU_2020_1001157_1_SI_ALB_TIR_016 TaxID=3077789 RepID=UPI0028ED8498|nr:PD-(D/E)XK nuclease family protein [Domibacillus sp. DTU_2020_1001157_1_SI_ALB_TIR_016]WNS82199.1 PD-(D/E)XK nuclease family protein [Domibacillus sp. DTU_2020_1001157_1_SI_ALB_TIR_016]